MANKKPFFFREDIQKKLKIILIASSVIWVALELFLHRHSHFAKSGFFSIDGLFGFYGLLGLISSLVLIGIAYVLGKYLKVDEGYYDDDF